MTMPPPTSLSELHPLHQELARLASYNCMQGETTIGLGNS